MQFLVPEDESCDVNNRLAAVSCYLNIQFVVVIFIIIVVVKIQIIQIHIVIKQVFINIQTLSIFFSVFFGLLSFFLFLTSLFRCRFQGFQIGGLVTKEIKACHARGYGYGRRGRRGTGRVLIFLFRVTFGHFFGRLLRFHLFHFGFKFHFPRFKVFCIARSPFSTTFADGNLLHFRSRHFFGSRLRFEFLLRLFLLQFLFTLFPHHLSMHTDIIQSRSIVFGQPFS
mmetsp:Transcript_20915/g.43719  ORF Transcript_20915/g.43719 Transcript_20915/m.43719 type:complete len:226 (+) Transcript_20915:47-724(+)